jgi:hypothetical protein
MILALGSIVSADRPWTSAPGLQALLRAPPSPSLARVRRRPRSRPIARQVAAPHRVSPLRQRPRPADHTAAGAPIGRIEVSGAQSTDSTVLSSLRSVVGSSLSAVKAVWDTWQELREEMIQDEIGYLRAHPEQVLILSDARGTKRAPTERELRSAAETRFMVQGFALGPLKVVSVAAKGALGAGLLGRVKSLLGFRAPHLASGGIGLEAAGKAGAAIGQALRGQTGRMASIVGQVTKLGLPHAEAVAATNSTAMPHSPATTGAACAHCAIVTAQIGAS